MSGTEIAQQSDDWSLSEIQETRHRAQIALRRGDIRAAKDAIVALRVHTPPEGLSVVYKLEEELAELESARSWSAVPKTAWVGAIGALAAAVIAGGCAIAAASINSAAPPVPCIQALKNVDEALKMGVTDPVILGNLNPAEVDARCGDEQAMKKSLGK